MLDEREIPLSVEKRYAKHDPILAGMIRRGVPLTRNAYLMLSYGADLPEGEDWTAEHKAELPEPFRRPLKHARRRRGTPHAHADRSASRHRTGSI